MWFVVVCNALALISKWLFDNKTMLFCITAFSCMAYYRRYANIAWTVFYRHSASGENRETGVNIFLMNEVTTFICLFGIYFLLAIKYPLGCIGGTAVQCLAFHLFDTCKSGSSRNIIILFFYLIEFVLLLLSL